MLQNHHRGFDPHALDSIGLAPVETALLAQARCELRSIIVEDGVLRYLSGIVRATRTWPALSLGASPRAGVSLLLVAKGRAALEDRDYVIPDDIKAAALPVLRHRMLLKPEAELEAIDTDRVIADVLASVEVPK